MVFYFFNTFSLYLLTLSVYLFIYVAISFRLRCLRWHLCSFNLLLSVAQFARVLNYNRPTPTLQPIFRPPLLLFPPAYIEPQSTSKYIYLVRSKRQRQHLLLQLRLRLFLGLGLGPTFTNSQFPMPVLHRHCLPPIPHVVGQRLGGQTMKEELKNNTLPAYVDVFLPPTNQPSKQAHFQSPLTCWPPEAEA